jgi:alpha-amylase
MSHRSHQRTLNVPQTQLTECWAGDQRVPLPDLKTTSERVRRGYNEWISHLITTYSIDGLRLDTVPHVEQSFWKGFVTAAGGLYMLGEVFDANTEAACEYQKYISGIMTYPM